jgi:purine-cytosine permease-like protein
MSPQTPRSGLGRVGEFLKNPQVEDYALRYAPSSFRAATDPWKVFLSTLGGVSALFAYAFGAQITMKYGFSNVLWGTIAFGIIFFIVTLPICYSVARNNIDMDLITRGAGFGYLGSTITSLVYAAYTMMIFATEGSIMAQGLEEAFGIPLRIGYVIAALAIIPLALYGVRFLSKFQGWTMPLWIALIVFAAFCAILSSDHSLSEWVHFGGNSPSGADFSLPLFSGLLGGLFSLMTQVGEQVDFLRFLPEKTQDNRVGWWAALIFGGPATELLIVGPFLLGSLFAATTSASNPSGEPIKLFTDAYTVMLSPQLALLLAGLLIIVAQLKINVTNSYSGSLSLSNFFSRVLHRHPGRPVWLIVTILIALLLMELGIFDALDLVLSFFGNIAIAWIGAVFVDIVINKHLLHISPSYMEFKRAHLHAINPAGFGSMVIASVVSIAAFLGVFGSTIIPYSSAISFILVLVLTPALAVLTKGKYYIARTDVYLDERDTGRTYTCIVCEEKFEANDMAFCPFHDGPICSLCCTLERFCHDVCKTEVVLTAPPSDKIKLARIQAVARHRQKFWGRSWHAHKRLLIKH